MHASTPESDEVAGHAFRNAQARRLLRFCRDAGLDYDEVVSRHVDASILNPICDENRKIKPEAIDFA